MMMADQHGYLEVPAVLNHCDSAESHGSQQAWKSYISSLGWCNDTERDFLPLSKHRYRIE